MFPIPPPRRFQHNLATFESVHKGDHNGVVGISILLCYVFFMCNDFPLPGMCCLLGFLNVPLVSHRQVLPLLTICMWGNLNNFVTQDYYG